MKLTNCSLRTKVFLQSGDTIWCLHGNGLLLNEVFLLLLFFSRSDFFKIVRRCVWLHSLSDSALRMTIKTEVDFFFSRKFNKILVEIKKYRGRCFCFGENLSKVKKILRGSSFSGRGSKVLVFRYRSTTNDKKQYFRLEISLLFLSYSQYNNLL